MLNALVALMASGTMLIAHEHLSVFQAKLQAMLGDPKAAEVAALVETAAAGDDDFWPRSGDESFLARLRPYKVVDGILHVPVFGVLLHRFPYAWGSYATGYEYIRQAINRGLRDANVRGIALVEDSPGGMVAGCFELCEEIAEAVKKKPLRAYASDHAFSAAFAIASQAESISVTRSGGVGSVGVVTSHIDFSGYLANEGIKITFIHAGKHKVDGNSFEPLSDDAKERIQARIDKLYGVFVSTVAEGRDMTEDAVRKTEALCYDAEEAVSVGFADRIESLEDGLAIYSADLETEEMKMADFTQAQYDEGTAAARADGEKAGKDAGRKEGANAERERINAILDSDEGKKRPKAALSIGLDTEMTVEQATKFLGKQPEEKAATATGDFIAAMTETPNPDLAGAPTGGDGDKLSRAERAFALAGKPKKRA